MGRALALAALARGHQVTIVSGPVEVAYPSGVEVHRVITTEEMLAACRKVFPACDGLIGVAAPCDYRARQVAEGKIHKTGQPLVLELIETPDIVATLASEKRAGQWIVGFALETEDAHFRAVTKLQQKKCDLLVLNGPQAMHSAETQVEIINPAGEVVAALAGSKEQVSEGIVEVIVSRLVSPA
jgi:phosphopantothenoylcysteine decarboxylase/phosphopantothenate--cysteine ligase